MSDTFITYTHPDQQADRQNRRKVASYIGTHFRNRSKPATRKSAQQVSRARGTVQEAETEVNSRVNIDVPENAPEQSVVIPRDSHGLRDDPFNSYPVETTQWTPGAIDYFLIFFAPTHLLRPEQIAPGMGKYVVHQYFRYALQNTFMFESLVALSQANLSVALSPEHKPDHGSLHHYGRAIREIRKAIGNESVQGENAMLFAISALMGVDYLLTDLSSFQVHLLGIRQIVDMRGGLDKLGWPMLLKPMIVGLESFWSYICAQPYLINVPITCEPRNDLVTVCPTGSCRRLDNLDRTISKLPTGIGVLARDQRLRTEIVNLVYRVTFSDSWLSHVRFPTPWITRNGKLHFDSSRLGDARLSVNASNLQEMEYAASLLTKSGLSYLERVVCIAMLIICISTTKSEQNSKINMLHFQNLADILLQAPLTKDDPDATNLYIWVSLTLAKTLMPETEAVAEARQTETSSVQEWYPFLQDKRFQLALRIHRWVTSHGDPDNNDDTQWNKLERTTKTKFIWSDRCLAGHKWVWQLAGRWRQQHPNEQQ